jgi:hypothetical protein
VVDQGQCTRVHAPAATARTEPATLAAPSHNIALVAGGAEELGQTPRQDATAEPRVRVFGRGLRACGCLHDGGLSASDWQLLRRLLAGCLGSSVSDRDPRDPGYRLRRSRRQRHRPAELTDGNSPPLPRRFVRADVCRRHANVAASTSAARRETPKSARAGAINTLALGESGSLPPLLQGQPQWGAILSEVHASSRLGACFL